MMAGKSILFITREIVPFYYGGIGTQFKALANLLTKAGFQVTFITQRHDSFDDSLCEKNYPGCQFFFTHLKYENSFVDYSHTGGVISHFNSQYASAVCDLLDEIYHTVRPDVVVSADYGGEAFFSLLKKQAGAYPDSSFVLFNEGTTYDALTTYQAGIDQSGYNELNAPQNILTCSMEDLCFYFADRIISPTNINWHQTQKRLDCTLEASIIPNLVVESFFEKNIDSAGRQEAENILFVGRLDRHKGADILLKSFVEYYAQKNIEDIPTLRFVGRDTFCKSYEETFLAHWRDKIPDFLLQRIDFTGQVTPDKVRQYMAEATVCVFPSRWEVFGIVCLEAMASGCPVIVSDKTGLIEIVGDTLEYYAVDIEKKRFEIFKLYEELKIMSHDEYKGLTVKFLNRAKEVFQSGNNQSIAFFSKLYEEQASLPCRENSREMYEKISLCLSGMSHISSVLAHDFNQITTNLGLNTEDVRDLIVGEQKSTRNVSQLNEKKYFEKVKNFFRKK